MLLKDYQNSEERKEALLEEKKRQYIEDVRSIILEAAELGILGTEEDGIASEAGTILKRGKSNVIALNQDSKRKLLASQFAIAQAKANGDNDYKQLVKLNKKRKQLQAKIRRKYKSSSLRAAKKAIKEYTKTSSIMQVAKGSATSSKEAAIKQKNSIAPKKK